MTRRKRVLLGVALILACLFRPAAAEPREAGNGRFYLYGLGAVNWFRYLEFDFTVGRGVSPLLGIGYRVADLDRADRVYVNLALDLAPMSFRFPVVGSQSVRMVNLMAEAEVRLGKGIRRSPFSLYAGIGGGWVRLPWSDRWPPLTAHPAGQAVDFTVLAFEVGFKHAALPSRRLLLRGGLRFQGEVYGGDGGYLDEWGDWNQETVFDRVNTQFLLGLEIHP